MKRKRIIILLGVLLSFLTFGCGEEKQENQSKNILLNLKATHRSDKIIT